MSAARIGALKVLSERLPRHTHPHNHTASTEIQTHILVQHTHTLVYRDHSFMHGLSRGRSMHERVDALDG